MNRDEIIGSPSSQVMLGKRWEVFQVCLWSNEVQRW